MASRVEVVCDPSFAKLVEELGGDRVARLRGGDLSMSFPLERVPLLVEEAVRELVSRRSREIHVYAGESLEVPIIVVGKGSALEIRFNAYLAEERMVLEEVFEVLEDLFLQFPRHLPSSVRRELLWLRDPVIGDRWVLIPVGRPPFLVDSRRALVWHKGGSFMHDVTPYAWACPEPRGTAIVPMNDSPSSFVGIAGVGFVVAAWFRDWNNGLLYESGIWINAGFLEEDYALRVLNNVGLLTDVAMTLNEVLSRLFEEREGDAPWIEMNIRSPARPHIVVEKSLETALVRSCPALDDPRFGRDLQKVLSDVFEALGLRPSDLLGGEVERIGKLLA